MMSDSRVDPSPVKRGPCNMLILLLANLFDNLRNASFDLYYTSYFSVCPAGGYINTENNNNCEECKVGFYSDAPNSNGCSPCPPGLTTETSGTSSTSGCCTCFIL